MAASGFLAVFLLLAVAAPLVLWLLIESETDDPDVMDRRSAEESARADSRAVAEHQARRDTDDGSDRGF
jgi:hypothetical protein